MCISVKRLAFTITSPFPLLTSTVSESELVLAKLEEDDDASKDDAREEYLVATYRFSAKQTLH